MSPLPRHLRRHGAVLGIVTALVASAAALVPAPSQATGAPANDDFQNAQVLSGLPVSVSGSNVGATIQPNEQMPEGQQPSGTVWYSWTAPSTGPIEIDLFDSADIDTVLAAYTLAGSTLVPAALDDDYNTATHHFRSAVTIFASAGTTYYLQLGGYDEYQRWPFTMKITPMTTGITGVVTRNGAPVAGACATLVGGVSGSHGITDSLGRYALTGDPGTSFSLSVTNCLGTTDIQPAALGGSLAINAGSITSASTVDTTPGSSVSGRVVNQNGAPVTNGCALASRTTPTSLAVRANVDPTGHYVIRGLPDGTYTVSATSCGPDLYPSTPASGSYAVAAQSSLTVPDIQVTEDGQISGTVLTGSTPVPPGCVHVFSGASEIAHVALDGGTTLAAGGYTVNVAPGTYQVEFATQTCSTAAVSPQWFDNVASQAAATTITVVPGRILDGVNANFQSGGVTYPAPVIGTDSTPFASPICARNQATAAAASAALTSANAANAAAQAKVRTAAAAIKKLQKQIKTAKRHGASTAKLTKRLTKAKKALLAARRAAAARAAAAAAAGSTSTSANAAVSGSC